MKTGFLLIGILALLSPAGAIAGPKSEDIVLRDGKRGKELQCRVHFPESGSDLPLVIFSHGFGGDRTAFGPVSQFLAENGYVVVHPSHTDGFGGSGGLRTRRAGQEMGERTSRLGALRSGGGGLAGLMNDPAKVEDRIADVIAVLDGVSQLTEKLPDLQGRIDPDRCGVGGHSYGAYTAMLIGGVTVDLGGVEGRSFSDPRVRAILPISGQGTGQQGLTEASWADLKSPMMTITGSRDRGAGGQGPDWKKEPYLFSPPGDKFLVYIEGANHMSFGGGLGGRSSDSTEVVKATALAFWNAYLKNDEAAKTSLTSGEVVKPFADSAKIESK